MTIGAPQQKAKRKVMIRIVLGTLMAILLPLVTLTGMMDLVSLVQQQEPDYFAHSQLGFLIAIVIIAHVSLNWRGLRVACQRIIGQKSSDRASMTRAFMNVALLMLLPLVVLTGKMGGNILLHAVLSILMVVLITWHIVLNRHTVASHIKHLRGRQGQPAVH